MATFAKMSGVSRFTRRPLKVTCNTYKHVRVCVDCIHFDPNNNTCKAAQSFGKPVKTLYSRTSEDFCGLDAKLFTHKGQNIEEYLWEGTDEYEVYAKYAQSQGWEPQVEKEPVNDIKSIVQYWLNQ